MESFSRQQMNAEIAAGLASRSYKLIKPGSEDEIQANYFSWVDLYIERFPEMALIFAIPNAGFASKKQGGLRKLTGRRAGVPDVCVPVEGGMEDGTRYLGLWIEFKRPGEKATTEQLKWHAKLREAGHYVAIFETWTEAANLTIDYLRLDLTKF